jgi:hypothetical protein
MTIPLPEVKIEPTITQDKVETNLTQQIVDTQQNQSEPEKSEDPNWKAFREARKKDRSEMEAAQKRAQEKEAEAHALKAAMDAILNKGHAPQQVQYGYPEEETEDQRIEKKVQAAIIQREQVAEQERQRREQKEYPKRLQDQFPDFLQMISEENQDYLVYHFPEVASPLKRLPEGYDKWHDIYKAIKKFIPNQNARRDALRADNNLNKPKSISSTGLTQTGDTSNATQLTKDRKAANWERMEKMRKGIS